MSSGRVKDYARKNRKRLDPKDYRFIKLENQSLTKQPGQINGESFMIDSLVNCDVIIADNSAQITMDDCTNTRIVLGPIKGSFFLRNCHNCHVTVACRQFRCVDCTNCTIRLYCQTESPVIESSSSMLFMPWNVSYQNLSTQFQAAELDPKVNFWNSIFDFTPETATIPQPHYIISEEFSSEMRYITFDGESTVHDNPVPLPTSPHVCTVQEWLSYPYRDSTTVAEEEKLVDSPSSLTSACATLPVTKAASADDVTEAPKTVLCVDDSIPVTDVVSTMVDDDSAYLTRTVSDGDDVGVDRVIFGSMLDDDDNDDTSDDNLDDNLDDIVDDEITHPLSSSLLNGTADMDVVDDAGVDGVDVEDVGVALILDDIESNTETEREEDAGRHSRPHQHQYQRQGVHVNMDEELDEGEEGDVHGERKVEGEAVEGEAKGEGEGEGMDGCVEERVVRFSICSPRHGSGSDSESGSDDDDDDDVGGTSGVLEDEITVEAEEIVEEDVLSTDAGISPVGKGTGTGTGAGIAGKEGLLCGKGVAANALLSRRRGQVDIVVPEGLLDEMSEKEAVEGEKREEKEVERERRKGEGIEEEEKKGSEGNMVSGDTSTDTVTDSATDSADTDGGMVVAEWEDWEDWDAVPARSRTETVSNSSEDLSDPRVLLLKQKNLLGVSVSSPGKTCAAKVSHSRLLRPSKKELELEQEKEKERAEEVERERRKTEELKKRKTLDMDAIACITSLEDLERLERIQAGNPSPRNSDEPSLSRSGSSPRSIGDDNGDEQDDNETDGTSSTPRLSPRSRGPHTTGTGTGTGDGTVDWDALTQTRNAQLITTTTTTPSSLPADAKYADIWRAIRDTIWSTSTRPTIIKSDTRSVGFLSSCIFCICGPPRFSGVDAKGQDNVLYAAATAFDSSNAAHGVALQGLYRNILGEACALQGEHWTTIGFQGTNPSTDLRGTGIWGLLQLYYLSETYPVLTKKLYDLSIDEKQRFPMAVSCINMSGLVIQWLRTPAAISYRGKEGRNFTSVEEMVMHVYVACVYKLYCLWRTHGYTIREYSKAKSQVGKMLSVSAHTLVKALETGHRETD